VKYLRGYFIFADISILARYRWPPCWNSSLS